VKHANVTGAILPQQHGLSLCKAG